MTSTVQPETLESSSPPADHHQPSPPATTETETETVSTSDLSTLVRNVSSSRLNAKAPEFVPRSASSSDLTQPPPLQAPPPPPRIVVTPPNHNQQPGLIHVYSPSSNSSPSSSSPSFIQIPNHVNLSIPVQYHPHHHHSHPHPHPHTHLPVQYSNSSSNNAKNNHNQRQYNNGRSGGFVDHQQVELATTDQLPAFSVDSDRSRNGVASSVDDTTQKVLNQVEFYFSDVNLATTDHLMRFINKDPEGYVPISVVASFKKIKALTSSISQLANILRKSSKLVVSEDGKKVRRKQPLTDSDMEELQARIVVAENLPEDHCHQNLMKIFSAVGSVKMIRTCQPQPSSGGASSATRAAKGDGMLLNKLHAFVEYESVEVAEKAVVELNDEGNWRNGLRIRLLHKRGAKPAQARGKKAGHEGEAHRKEDGASTSEQHEPNDKRIEDSSQETNAQSHEHTGEEHTNEKEGGQTKKKSRGRGKGRGRSQYHHQNNHRGSHVGTPPSNIPVVMEAPILAKQPPGPRMPDGTRGFSRGRGKPLALIT